MVEFNKIILNSSQVHVKQIFQNQRETNTENLENQKIRRKTNCK